MDIRQRLFQYRSYTPIPFLLAMFVFAEPTCTTMIVGGGILFLGEALRLWGVAIAGSETRTTGSVGGTFLVTTGPFAYVRNPLYLGNLLIYAGFGVMSSALFPWLLVFALLFFYVQYSFIVSLEEGYLSTTYGEEYARYRSSVFRFIPKPRRYVQGNNPQPPLDWADGFRSDKRTLQALVLVVVALVVVWLVRG